MSEQLVSREVWEVGMALKSMVVKVPDSQKEDKEEGQKEGPGSPVRSQMEGQEDQRDKRTRGESPTCFKVPWFQTRKYNGNREVQWKQGKEMVKFDCMCLHVFLCFVPQTAIATRILTCTQNNYHYIQGLLVVSSLA